MNSRYLGALILSPLLIVLFIGGTALKYLALILSLLGMSEFYKVLKEKNIHPLSYIGYAMCLIYYVFLNLNVNQLFNVITISVMVLLIIPILNRKYNFIDASITLLGFLYIAVFFSFIVLVSRKVYGNYLVWTIFISSWICDTSAYYTGKYFGKTKLCPEISPKKTIEGSIGGLLGSSIACGLFGMFLQGKGVTIPIIHFFLLGGISGILVQFGDLVASSIKRFLGVKDYSDLIPGHGGILDRFDSILFAAIVVYYYFTLIVLI
ncbi:phosphatidate cytidylyltransferase [uncultured Clostridium sp.]|uniref:phosphatidate cytidylyltransferase n=1 Tax=uncultured Clostridium sp. TaxID=59620 RepID=UPI0028E9D90B|nr:phosphatidate cytidylyltransferase [uncultured Clostridium sp.]